MMRLDRILCVIKPGQVCTPVMEQAVALALDNQASLTVVAVAPRMSAGIGMPDGGPISAELQSAVGNEAKEALASAAAVFSKRLAIDVKVLVGTPYLEVIREVLASGQDLVIKVPENPDWLDRLFGNDDMHLLRQCPSPVWMMKCKAPSSYRRVLAAVDIGDADPVTGRSSQDVMNHRILEFASSLALPNLAELHVVHAWEAVGERIMRTGFTSHPEAQIRAYVEGVRRQHEARFDALMRNAGEVLGEDTLTYLKARTHLVQGPAEEWIPALAKELQIDLIVMGTVGRTGIPGLFIGNTAETILEKIDCSVLTIKPPGFTTMVSRQE